MFRNTIIAALLGLQVLCQASIETNALELVTQIKPVQQIILSYLPDSWEQVRELTDSQADVTYQGAADQLAFSPDEEHIAIVCRDIHRIHGSWSAYQSPGVDVLNIKTGKLLRNIKLIYTVSCAAFLCGGKYLALGEKDGNRVTVINTVTDETIAARAVAMFRLPDERPAMTHFGSLSDTTQLLTFFKNKKISRWDFAKNQLTQFTSPAAITYISPNNNFTVTEENGPVVLRDQSGSLVRKLYQSQFTHSDEHGLFSGAFSPDNNYFAFKYATQNNNLHGYVTDGTPILIVDIKTGDCIAVLDQPNEGKICAYSPCGNYLAASYLEYVRIPGLNQSQNYWIKYLTLWDSKAKKALQVINRNNTGIKQVCFSPTGEYMAIIWDDQKVCLYKNDKKELESAIARKRNLVTLCNAALKLDEYYFW